MRNHVRRWWDQKNRYWQPYPIQVIVVSSVQGFGEWNAKPVVVYCGPAAPFPSLPPVWFHTTGCFLDDCDGGCLYEE